MLILLLVSGKNGLPKKDFKKDNGGMLEEVK